AYFAGDVESETRAADGSGEERFEQLRPRLGAQPRAIVHDVQFYNTAGPLHRYPDLNAGGPAPAMSQGIAAQVPHDLVEVAAIEQHLGLRRQFDREDAGIDFLDLRELFHKPAQKIDQPEALAMRALAPVQP